jgi:tetratricopeptide (TPR) repeat protein
MEKHIKLYMKAISSYQNGYIDKALEYCEMSIALNLKNPSALNLKGLLLYLKGDLEGASGLWSLNKDVNKDPVSKKYLQDIKEEVKRQKVYEKASELIKEVHIKEALTLLEICSESDFNALNVNNSISICLMRQGKYEEALKYIEKVLSIDKNNKIAQENKKLLIEYGAIKKPFNLRKFGGIVSIMGLLIIVLYAGLEYKAIIFNRTSPEENKPKIDTLDSNLSISVNKSNEINKEENKSSNASNNIESFPRDMLTEAIEKKQYETVYSYYLKWKDVNMSINDKTLLKSGENLLKTEGVEFLYNMGYENMYHTGDVTKALDYYIKAYSLGKEHYLYKHIVFMLGAAYEKKGDIENAIIKYEEYYSNFKNEAYFPTVLYNLMMINRNLNIEKAKKYANEIAVNYPKSIYNNSNVWDLMNK